MSGSNFFQHDQALVETTKIGDATRIWAFVHILPGAQIGRDCNICDHVFIENDVTIGDRVTVKSGVQIWDGLVLEDDVFIGPNVTFTNDPWPRSKQQPEKFAITTLCRGVSIGANATILPGITIGQHAMIGAGSVVTRSVPPHAIVYGNPATIRKYSTGNSAGSPGVDKLTQKELASSVDALELADVKFDLGHVVHDLRGNLIAREIGNGLPFEPRRIFIVFDVPTKEVRGEHAHKECHQFLIGLTGSITCVVDDGEHRAEFTLDDPAKGLYVPPMVWATQYKYSRDAALLVLASHEYDANDYIRDYDAYLDLKRLSQENN